MLDHACLTVLSPEVQKLFKPGGRLLFFEGNRWSPVFQMPEARQNGFLSYGKGTSGRIESVDGLASPDAFPCRLARY